MIVLRDTFRLKIGKAKEAVDQINKAKEISKKLDMKFGRVMTDITGPFYTLVLEFEYENLGIYEQTSQKMFANDDWKDWYKNFSPLLESGYREIFKLI